MHISKKTLCEAKKLLIASGLIYMQFCIKKNGAFSCNSYFLIQNPEFAPENTEITVACLFMVKWIIEVLYFSPLGNNLAVNLPLCQIVTLDD